MPNPGNLVSICTLHRAESAAQQLTAQLRAFESNNDHPGLFSDDLEAMNDLTNRIVAVRDGMNLATPRTLVQVGQLEICAAPSLGI